MRQPRLKAPPEFPVGYYHCLSGVVDRRFVLGNSEKEQFVKYLRLYEAFCQVQVVTFCVMSNHFHILVEVPRRPDEASSISDEAFLAHIKKVYRKFGYGRIEQKLRMLRETGAHEEAEAYRESFFARMWDVSAYLKHVKQRFTQWYNRQNGRKGTLWEERFKSVLVEGAGEALATMAAYIDLNPVRAGIVDDPKDYRWSGYGEAVAGNRNAKEGLHVVTASARGNFAETKTNAKTVLSDYRLLLFGRGEARGLDGVHENARALKRGLDRQQIVEVLSQNGKLSHAEMLRCKVRYFADGAVLGTKEFVNAIFRAERHRFGPKRQSGARMMRFVDAGSLRTLRDLRVDPVSASV